MVTPINAYPIKASSARCSWSRRYFNVNDPYAGATAVLRVNSRTFWAATDISTRDLWIAALSHPGKT